MKQSVSEMLNRKQKGFTLIELVIVVAVIIILTSIAAAGMTIYLKDARDNERAGKMTILVEALERYYDQNGEYPSCAVLSDSNVSSAAQALGGIDLQTFVAPSAEEGTTNSINCSSDQPTGQPDTFNYSSTPAVASNTAMRNYTLRYWSEGNNSVETVMGRRGREP
ncbi:prepilin-type N-terminal cleavage/methylation domain-containing protein [Candidatus Saccharibacteria bacterium TM7i]|nr:prepilin-type N-terminal cleavage/methylation domain-containing protein [Candidatus Saccharibacteria bacterium TM7i]